MAATACSGIHMLGTSGTVTTIAGVHLDLKRYDRNRVDGCWMSAQEISAVVERLLAMSYEDRVASPCIGAERADLVLAGCAILEAIRRAFPCPRLRVADRGLREGMLVQMMREDGVWGGGSQAAARDGARQEGGGSRALKVRVKSGKGRTLSSKLWLERQLNDPYVARAKREGYRSRAAYKLMEIDDKARFLKKGARVVDLGAAPGGWSQVAAKRVGAPEPGPRGRHRYPADGAGRRRRFPAARFPRSRRAGETEGDARRAGRRRALRHGGQRHRPRQHRSLEDHGAGGDRPPNSPARCWRRAARSSPRCCKAAPRPRCSPRSSATSQASSTSSRRRAASDSAELYLLATGFRGGGS